MLDRLFNFLGEGAIHRTAMVANICSNVVKAFEQEFQQDGNAKDAAIDTLISLLQQHKSFGGVNNAPKTVPITGQPAPVPPVA